MINGLKISQSYGVLITSCGPRISRFAQNWHSLPGKEIHLDPIYYFESDIYSGKPTGITFFCSQKITWNK